MINLIILIGMFVLFGSGCSLLEPPYIEVTTGMEVFEGRFYYEQLSEEEQLVYREIYEGVMQDEEAICVHSANADDTNELLGILMNDFPELFWIDGSASSTTYGKEDKEGSFTIIEPTYIYSGEKKLKMQKEIETATAAILAGIPAEYDHYSKIKYIYEYLVNTAEYVEEASDDQNVYSALVNHETVCAGYAKANQYLLNELGIPCTYVLGTANADGTADSHAWNIVECNGKYYYVDVTWADPIVEEGEAAEEIEQPMIYDYLCCSDSELEDTHVLEEGYAYPECYAEDLNYYKLNGMYYETADSATLLKAMKSEIDKKTEAIVFKFAGKAQYEQARAIMEKVIIENAAQYLMTRYNMEQVEYYFSEEEALNKITIFWIYQ